VAECTLRRQKSIWHRRESAGARNHERIPVSYLTDAQGGCHGLAVNQSMREGAAVQAGDPVRVVIGRDEGERRVEVPPRLKKELTKSKVARSNREKLAYTNQKEIVLSFYRSIDQPSQTGNARPPSGEGHGYPEDGPEMDGLAPQAFDHFGNVILLK
jgi:hypothetical protein